MSDTSPTNPQHSFTIPHNNPYITTFTQTSFPTTTSTTTPPTTFFISRFYDPLEGKVYLDETPVSDYNLHWLRDNISIVSQVSFFSLLSSITLSSLSSSLFLSSIFTLFLFRFHSPPPPFTFSLFILFSLLLLCFL